MEDFNYANGFIRGRGCPDACFTLKQLLRKRSSAKIDTYVLFLDLVKAYDSVDRNALFGILERFGFEPKFVDAVRNLHVDLRIVLRHESAEDEFGNNVGIM